MNEKELIDDCASEILELLSRIVPEREDDGELGEKILEKALDTYREVLLIMLKYGD